MRGRRRENNRNVVEKEAEGNDRIVEKEGIQEWGGKIIKL